MKELVGVSPEMVVIQDSFLKFELEYKSTQSIFSSIYKLVKTAKKANLENLNDETYKIAELLVNMSEKYVETKTKVLALDGNMSKLDAFLKQDILYMIEQNRTMLGEIEVKVKGLLDTLVGRNVISQSKVNKMLQNEERATDSVIFVSKYEVLDAQFAPDYMQNWFIKNYLWKMVILIPFLFLLISGDLLSVITGVIGKIVGTDSTAANLGAAAVWASSLSRLLSSAVSILAMLIILITTFRMMIDVMYLSIPLLRPILGEYMFKKWGVPVDYFDAEPIQIEKFKLVRAKEILYAIKSIPGYEDSYVLAALTEMLEAKTTSDVLTLEENYAIILTENLYTMVNMYYKSNKNLVGYCLGINDGVFTTNPLVMKILVLQQRLGLNF